jgi:bacterioferritin
LGITKEELIKELNSDIEKEYAAVIQYVQHASVISGAQYESTQKELLVHSQEELQHATILSEQVEFLGGIPTTGVGKVEISDDNLEMLKLDLKREETAVERYKDRIEQAESLREYGLRRILEDILVQEEEHKRDLQAATDV